jgi:hypothetical protein
MCPAYMIDYRKEKERTPRLLQELLLLKSPKTKAKTAKGVRPGLHSPEGDKDGGQLVLLGFEVTPFTPEAYQRRSLQRPYEI